MKKVNIISLFLFFGILLHAQINTPYPETFNLNQIDGAEKERVRLCQTQKKYDRQPTAFYIEAGKKIVVNVEILTTADKNIMPELTVGTLGFNVNNRNTGTHFILKPGLNTISNHPGGLIWLSFITNDPADPKGKARISFVAGSEHVRVPHYVHGVTTDVEFFEMYNAYKTPDVLYSSDRVAVVATREAALLYSVFNTGNNRLYDWLDAIHTLLDEETKISGLFENDPNPLHRPLKRGEIRFLLVENTSLNPHASSAGYTGYPSGSRHRYLTKIGVAGNNTWMLGHEIGHQHQQAAYMISKAVESTVNIYSYVVERNIQGSSYNRTSAMRWQQVQDTYLKLPLSQRIYDMHDDSLRKITGYNHDETRFMVWEQKFLIFGDEFYQRLHRVVREEKQVNGGSPDERRAYLIWKASQVSGYDLTDFYNHWGIRVTDASIKALLRARIAHALSTNAIVKLPRPAKDFVMITGQNIPAWAKLPLHGITHSAPEFEEFNMQAWTITCSIQGASDAAIGGDLPQYIIDNNSATAFAFVKPGRTFAGISAPADYVPSFTFDMKNVKQFNFFKYTHRTSNTSNFLRARKISLWGSNDGVAFQPIVENYIVDHVKNDNVVTLEFSPSNYRFVRVDIGDWDNISGNTIQVQDVSLGYKNIEQLPTPTPIQFTVNVTVDENINCPKLGVNYVNEDERFNLQYNLSGNFAQTHETLLYVDNVLVQPTYNNSTYQYGFIVENHTDIHIATRVKTSASRLYDNKLQVFPNPLRIGQVATLKNFNSSQNTNFVVYNSLGKKVFELNNYNNTFSFAEVGVYFLINNTMSSALKVVVI